MLLDLVHRYGDGHATSQACGDVALTVALPAIPWGMEITPEMVRWPVVQDKQRVNCGTCGRYAGECLNGSCAVPHRCVLIEWPGGRMRCRAGCDPA
jgi:hypothetical protein